jgi:hypothetical protein
MIHEASWGRLLCASLCSPCMRFTSMLRFPFATPAHDIIASNLDVVDFDKLVRNAVCCHCELPGSVTPPPLPPSHLCP